MRKHKWYWCVPACVKSFPWTWERRYNVALKQTLPSNDGRILSRWAERKRSLTDGLKGCCGGLCEESAEPSSDIYGSPLLPRLYTTDTSAAIVWLVLGHLHFFYCLDLSDLTC